jgi:ubiquinone/menaquinone biosynthesis C-methylase UbiE
MKKPMSDLNFKVMTVMMKVRDFFLPREKLLEEMGVRPGDHVLDFGCGPGGYSLVAARRAGETGKVYALDIHPLAAVRIRESAAKKGLENIETICSSGATGLGDRTTDVALLTDTLHLLKPPDEILAELNRVLKPGGRLWVNDHHLKEDELVARVTDGGLFRLERKGRWSCCFVKKDAA